MLNSFEELCITLAAADSSFARVQTIMNFSYNYEYRENIHLGVKLTPA